jgi:hypothetical protein
MNVEIEQAHRADALLEPEVQAAIGRVGTQQFSTKRLIEEVRSAPSGSAAYDEALRLLEAGGTYGDMAYRVLHGQTIAGLLRSSPLVRFAGFIHGDPEQDDGYSVPSWWRKTA